MLYTAGHCDLYLFDIYLILPTRLSSVLPSGLFINERLGGAFTALCSNVSLRALNSCYLPQLS